MAKGKRRKSEAEAEGAQLQKKQAPSQKQVGEEGQEAIGFDPNVLDQSSSEVKFGRNLAHSTDKSVRDKTVQALRIWLRRRCGSQRLPDLDLLKIWRGLWFCMWMCDKAEVQEELAESMADLVHLYEGSQDDGISFLRAFFETMQCQWGKLDFHRIDKFYRLIRKVVREGLRFALRQGGDAPFSLINVIYNEVLVKVPNGPRQHLADIFVPELCLAAAEDSSTFLDTDCFMCIMEPWFDLLAKGGVPGQGKSSQAFHSRIREEIFGSLLDFSFGDEDFQEADKKFAGVDLRAVQSRIFYAAGDPESSERIRGDLWSLLKQYQKRTGMKGSDSSEESLWRKHQQKWTMRDRGENGPVYGWAAAAGVVDPTPTEAFVDKKAKRSKRGQVEGTEALQASPEPVLTKKQKRGSKASTAKSVVDLVPPAVDSEEEIVLAVVSSKQKKRRKSRSEPSQDAVPEVLETVERPKSQSQDGNKIKKRASSAPEKSKDDEQPAPGSPVRITRRAAAAVTASMDDEGDGSAPVTPHVKKRTRSAKISVGATSGNKRVSFGGTQEKGNDGARICIS
jgi:ribosomal RNA-processing protein 1